MSDKSGESFKSDKSDESGESFKSEKSDENINMESKDKMANRKS